MSEERITELQGIVQALQKRVKSLEAKLDTDTMTLAQAEHKIMALEGHNKVLRNEIDELKNWRAKDV